MISSAQVTMNRLPLNCILCPKRSNIGSHLTKCNNKGLEYLIATLKILALL